VPRSRSCDIAARGKLGKTTKRDVDQRSPPRNRPSFEAGETSVQFQSTNAQTPSKTGECQTQKRRCTTASVRPRTRHRFKLLIKNFTGRQTASGYQPTFRSEDAREAIQTFASYALMIYKARRAFALRLVESLIEPARASAASTFMMSYAACRRFGRPEIGARLSLSRNGFRSRFSVP